MAVTLYLKGGNLLVGGFRAAGIAQQAEHNCLIREFNDVIVFCIHWYTLWRGGLAASEEGALTLYLLGPGRKKE